MDDILWIDIWIFSHTFDVNGEKKCVGILKFRNKFRIKTYNKSDKYTAIFLVGN